MGPSVKRFLPICLNGSVRLNKMTVMPRYVETLINRLLQNKESFWAESWYIALNTQDLPNVFK